MKMIDVTEFVINGQEFTRKEWCEAFMYIFNNDCPKCRKLELDEFACPESCCGKITRKVYGGWKCSRYRRVAGLN